jgi:hypothetical protein
MTRSFCIEQLTSLNTLNSMNWMIYTFGGFFKFEHVTTRAVPHYIQFSYREIVKINTLLTATHVDVDISPMRTAKKGGIASNHQSPRKSNFFPFSKSDDNNFKRSSVDTCSRFPDEDSRTELQGEEHGQCHDRVVICQTVDLYITQITHVQKLVSLYFRMPTCRCARN